MVIVVETLPTTTTFGIDFRRTISGHFLSGRTDSARLNYPLLIDKCFPQGGALTRDKLFVINSTSTRYGKAMLFRTHWAGLAAVLSISLYNSYLIVPALRTTGFPFLVATCLGPRHLLTDTLGNKLVLTI